MYDYDQYVKQAMRTDNGNLSEIDRLTNAALGLCGESGELAKEFLFENFKNYVAVEEMGDVLWYIAQASHVLHIPMSEIVAFCTPPSKHSLSENGKGIMEEVYWLEVNLLEEIINLHTYTGSFADSVKKHRYHEHKLSRDDMSKNLCEIVQTLMKLCLYLDIELETAARENIEKLQKRYPEGFNSHDSIHRSL